MIWLGDRDSNPNCLIQNQKFCRLNYPPLQNGFIISRHDFFGKKVGGRRRFIFARSPYTITFSACMAFFTRWIVSSRPSTTMLSNNGGETVRPVMATRKG